MSERADQLRAKILELTAEFVAEEFPEKEFIPGESSVAVAGRVFDAQDVQSLASRANSSVNLRSSLIYVIPFW